MTSYAGENRRAKIKKTEHIQKVKAYPTSGNYWHLPNLRQLLGAKDRRGSKMEKEDIIIDLFKRAAETDGEIRDTEAYRRWLKSVQG